MGDYEAGLAVRRAVLGDEYVERSLREADEFTAPFQRLVTEYCWGDIWTRDDLPRQTRSLINIAMLTALNRPDELRLHVRGACNNGCTTDEIRGVLLKARRSTAACLPLLTRVQSRSRGAAEPAELTEPSVEA